MEIPNFLFDKKKLQMIEAFDPIKMNIFFTDKLQTTLHTTRFKTKKFMRQFIFLIRKKMLLQRFENVKPILKLYYILNISKGSTPFLKFPFGFMFKVSSNGHITLKYDLFTF